MEFSKRCLVDEKKTLKLKFVGFQSKNRINGVRLENTWLYKTIEKYYNIELSDKPDYIICSCFDKYEYCKYPQVRIMYSGENYVPDFNLIDYAISSYPISFFDRNFYLPQSLFGYDAERSILEKRTRNYTKDFIKTKTKFANFIASYDSENNKRGDFFKELSKYKHIDSAGKWLNNTGEYVRFQDNSKVEFQRKCKFSLCFESTVSEGFNTEKIMDAFYAETIPIYYGDPAISSIFNPKAFINVADYESFDKAIQYILEIDADDEKYLKMMNEPIFVEENYITKTFEAAENFIVHIFEQDIEKVFRRSRVYWPKGHEEFILKATLLYQKVYCNKLIKKIKELRRNIKNNLVKFKKENN